MNGSRLAIPARLTCIVVLAFAVSGCTNAADAAAMHAGELQLDIKGQDILPSGARTRDGRPYTGAAYDTFFGDKQSRDCAEWEGSFRDGAPDGEFKLYSNCGELASRWRFEQGIWIKAAKN